MRFASCHPDRRHRSKGLCSRCYSKSIMTTEQILKARQRASEWRKNNLERANRLDRDKQLKKKFGISIEQYEKLLSKQKGLCALCLKPEKIVNGRGRRTSRLAVDHCHKTNTVRGLLCFRCNTSIAQIEREDLAPKLKLYFSRNK